MICLRTITRFLVPECILPSGPGAVRTVARVLQQVPRNENSPWLPKGLVIFCGQLWSLYLQPTQRLDAR